MPHVEHCRGPTLACSYGCVFSPLALLSCGTIIPFFLTDPQTKLGQQGTEFAAAITGVDLAHYNPIALTLTNETELAVGGTILGTNVHDPVGKTITATTTIHNQPVALRRPTKNRTVSLPSQACQTSLSSMLLTFRTLGVPIAEHKTEGPSLIIEFLGIIIDSQKMEARLPSDKLDRLFGDLNSWHTKSQLHSKSSNH